MQRIEDLDLRGGRRKLDHGPTTCEQATKLLARRRAERVGVVEKRYGVGRADGSDIAELTRVAQALKARQVAAGSLSALDQSTAARALRVLGKLEGQSRARGRVTATFGPRTRKARNQAPRPSGMEFR